MNVRQIAPADRAAAAQRRRREQDALFAHFVVVVGEDALRTLLEAITHRTPSNLLLACH
jgi:hypothetical protein